MRKNRPYIEIGTAELYYLLPSTKVKYREFNGETAVIAQLYSNLIGNIEIKRLAKIRINLGDSPDYTELMSEDYAYSRVLSWDKQFDFKTYFSLNNLEKKVALLEEIQKDVLFLCDKFKFDKQPFIEAYEKVKQCNYTASFIYKNKKYKNKDKSLTASLKITLEVEYAQLSVLFFDKNDSLIKEINCIKTLNHLMFVNEFVEGGGKWLDNKRFVLLGKEKQFNLEVSLEGLINYTNPEYGKVWE